MAPGHHDPKLLYAINGITAYHISNGQESVLTPGGPQTLSLLMVPTSSPYSDVPAGGATDAAPAARPEEDFYLHLHLPPELDLPLPATTQIYHQPPTSYLIPRWDLGPDSGAFTRLEFPHVGSRKGVQEDVDTFETILAQCTSFLERSPPPRAAAKKPSASSSSSSAAAASVVAGSSASVKYRKSSSSRSRKPPTDEPLPAYNPAEFAPGEAYVTGSRSSSGRGGQIVLVDEEDGSVIGELGEGFHVVEDSKLTPGSKDPVEITLPTDNSQSIAVAPASQEFVEYELHPAYKKSLMVSKAAAASRLIVTTSDLVSRALASQADSFAANTSPAGKPVTFDPSTHARVRKVHTFSASAAGLSAKAVGQIGHMAQNLGATLSGMGPAKEGSGHNGMPKGYGADGKLIADYKPGLLNKSLMAFSTIADGVDQAGRNLLTGTTNSVSNIVQHRWGPEAGELSRNLGGGFKNVALVYIDVTGVSRKAILKSVAKGMVVGKVSNGGGDLIVGGGDGGVVTMPAGEHAALEQGAQQQQPALLGRATSVASATDIMASGARSSAGSSRPRP